LKAGLDEIHRKQIAEKREQIASHINNAKETGSKAKNWIVDRMKQLDRAILEQDSDDEEVPVEPAEPNEPVEQGLEAQDEHVPPDNRRTKGLISEDAEESEVDILQEMRRTGDSAEDDESDNEDDGDEDSDDDKGKKDDDKLYHDKRFTDNRFTTTR
jgi:hypothetical protein